MINNWAEVRLGDELDILSGFPFNSSRFSTEEGVPLIRIRDLVNHNPETYFNGPYSSTFIIRKGDVIVGMDGDFNIVKWKGEDALLNQRLLRISGKKGGKINTDFIFFFLQPFLLDVNNKTAATTVKHLSTYDIANAIVVLPPFYEQRKIANILSTIDSQIEQTEAIIAKYQQIKQGVMHDLFTRGIDPATGKLRPSPSVAPALYKESSLGLVPQDWEVVHLSYLADMKSGYAFSSKDFVDEGIQLIRIGNLFNNVLAANREPVYLPLTFEKKYPDFVLKEGDVLISMTGTLGKRDYGFAVRIPEKGLFLLNQRVSKFIIKEFVNPNFFFNYLHTEIFLRQLYSLAGGTKQANLSNNQVLGIWGNNVPRNEQDIISARLVHQNKVIEKEKEVLSKLYQLKKGLMADLLSGKVRVTGDNQDNLCEEKTMNMYQN